MSLTVLLPSFMFPDSLGESTVAYCWHRSNISQFSLEHSFIAL